MCSRRCSSSTASRRARTPRRSGWCLFRAAFVFADSQTDPLPGVEAAPLEPPSEQLTGDSHHHLLERLEAFARTIDFDVAFEPLDRSAGGWCDAKRRRIVVDEALPANAQVRVLVHELAHALGVGYQQFGRARAEVIVDTVTFVVCSYFVSRSTESRSHMWLAGVRTARLRLWWPSRRRSMRWRVA